MVFHNVSPQYENGSIKVSKKKAELECFPGYQIEGNRISKLMHHNGIEIWIPPSLKCRLITTIQKPDVVNGKIKFVMRYGHLPVYPYRLYDEAVPECPFGYEAEKSILLPAGKEKIAWSPSTIYCQSKKIEKLPDTLNSTNKLPTVINGRCLTTSPVPYTVNTIAYSLCNNKYRPYKTYMSILKMDKNGILFWDPPVLQCNPWTTHILPAVENGILDKVQRNGKDINSPYKEFDYVKQICFDHHEPFEDPPWSILKFTDEKGDDLVWVPSILHCKPVHCPPLKAPLYTTLQKYSRFKGATATYKCHVKSIQVVKRTCLEDGTWSGKEPQCPRPSPFYPRLFVIFLIICLLIFVAFSESPPKVVILTK